MSEYQGANTTATMAGNLKEVYPSNRFKRIKRRLIGTK